MAVRDLPGGTVTFVFTDIEGSTLLLEQLGAEAYSVALAEHRSLLRQVFGEQGGHEVDTQGDAFFFAFETASGALEAASRAQDALRAGPIRVRIGVHTGTPRLTDEGYVGADVHRAARIAASGHGGQTLVSSSTAALVPDAPLEDLGSHRLKDLTAAERIFQLGAGAFPRLKTLFQTNLPVPATSFLGRGAELADVTVLLSRDDVRLLTLTGTAGTGKTRLALQAAGLAADGYPDGVWWVPLAPLRDPGLVLATAAQALDAVGTLAEHVRDRRMLILLDNFEHVIDAAPEVSALLGACPRLDVLVTSRERLRLGPEHEYAVPPLTRDEGIEFFTAKARAIVPDFEADGAVDAICATLDDLPLALELAAARVKVLPPEQIIERLERRLPLLTGGPRDVPERQRTLRAAIDWSYDLLDQPDQRAFQRLSVFAGGCTLVAAQNVAGADLDSLQSLLDKSLLRFTGSRYWMLESLREYASDRLEEAGEAEDMRARHAAFFSEMIESAGLSLEPEGEQEYASITAELDNIRAALDWLIRTDSVTALRATAALDGFWAVYDPGEGMTRLQALLEVNLDAPADVRARAYRALGSSANPAGDDALAERSYERSLEAYREAGDEGGVAAILIRLGISAFYRGAYDRAAVLGEESLALSREIGYGPAEAQALGLLGELEVARGNLASGAELIEQSADRSGEVGFPWWRSRMLRKLAECLLDLGEADRAAVALREALEIMTDIGDRQMTVFTLARFARMAAESGRTDEAGIIWGAIEAEEERGRMGAWASERERLGAPVLALADEDFERLREAGRLLTLDAVVAHVLAEE
jgi:predicted ATPase/class 3 adenylate cyclase